MSKLTEHYRQLLGLDASWEVSEVSLSLEEKRVEIVLEKIAYCAATHPAYHLASKSLAKIGDISITSRHIGNLAERVGEELTSVRAARTEAYFEQPLPRIGDVPSIVKTWPHDLANVA